MLMGFLMIDLVLIKLYLRIIICIIKLDIFVHHFFVHKKIIT